GPTVPVRVLIDREPAQATMADHPDLSIVETSPNGSVIVELSVNHPLGLWQFMVNLLDRAEILDPPEMRVGMIEYLTAHTAVPAGSGPGTEGNATNDGMTK
ncbi:MAG TPA: WYL domain-containing protein, partial [Microthrixaceae bacterium]|nr:WYL domain-containing protein [Microthrixaceae bacterium]